MRRYRWLIGMIALVAFLRAVTVSVAAREALTGPPTEQLRRAIEGVVATLEDPGLREEARGAERRRAIRTMAEDIFDLEETARRSLGLHWRGLTAAERQEFVGLFGDLLERAYLSRIEQYGGERIVYPDEEVDGDFALVKTRITLPKTSEQVPVDYRMRRRGERWLVYDVVIEGVSLVANYRSQFNRIIRTASYGELVRRMRARDGQ